MKKLKIFVVSFISLAIFGFILQVLGLVPKTETPKSPTMSSHSSTSKTKSESSSSNTDKNEPSSKVKYDLAQMNAKIADSFDESVRFNQEGQDGYEWTNYIHEIKLKDNGAINATVNDSFSNLSNTEKTDVLNSVSKAVNMVVFIETGEDKTYFITAYDTAGNKVAQSHMISVNEYNFK